MWKYGCARGLVKSVLEYLEAASLEDRKYAPLRVRSSRQSFLKKFSETKENTMQKLTVVLTLVLSIISTTCLY